VAAAAGGPVSSVLFCILAYLFAKIPTLYPGVLTPLGVLLSWWGGGLPGPGSPRAHITFLDSGNLDAG
jgi:hypothetical protein